MTESIITALVHLFAIVESAKEDTDAVDSGELVIKPYLKKNLNNDALTLEYISLFYHHLNFYKKAPTHRIGDDVNINSTSLVQIAKICNELNKELLQSERLIVFMQLMELIHADGKVTEREEEFASLVALNFNLDQADVSNLKAFIRHPDSNMIDNENLLIINNKHIEGQEDVGRVRSEKVQAEGKHLYVENLFGDVLVLHLLSIESFVFRYEGPLNLYLEGTNIIPGKAYILKPGAIIKGSALNSIYELEITRQFIQKNTNVRVVIEAESLAFKFKNGDNGLKPFTFSEESGQLIGIMGGSGAGKSTLMNLLNGKIAPSSGRVHINGFSLEKASAEGVIGYVPQDDLLFEELTVYQNLYFNAQVCFSNFSNDLLKDTVNRVLEDLDLVDIKNLKVSDPLHKTISGGQRKRLNIALELMREPSVLFVDEPTSGLSSMDSEKMMFLLKNLARKGKLVIAILHQPSSDIFKLLDKLWMLDKGGYPIYSGNPVDAVVYFKTMNTQVNAAESECPRCGNVIPEQILQIIEAREINDDGTTTRERRVQPHAWYQKYQENILPRLTKLKYDMVLPLTNFHIPTLWHQFKIFSRRNFLAKIANRQYVIINLLEAPLLAFILGYFSKYSPEGQYAFSENINLPVYLFMSVVVALFMGLTISAQEIYKDRQILERESFLNLSRWSYLNSKIIYLFVLSAIQMFAFVVVGNYILEIHDMSIYYWVVLFSTACFANIVGLNISSALNSIINIYILIPFILVPQLLLGGAMIKFDELHHSISNQKNVPVVGDLMASRWAYEALAVAQFRYNDYEKPFFEINQEVSQYSFNRSFLIPELITINRELQVDSTSWLKSSQKFAILNTELLRLVRLHGFPPFSLLSGLSPKHYSLDVGTALENYLMSAKRYFANKYIESSEKKDSIYLALIDRIGKKAFHMLEKRHNNEFLEALLTNKALSDMVYRGKDQLIQKKDPILMRPYSHYGRAHFYAPYKIIGSLEIPTFVFNLLFIWMMILFLYVTLLYNSLKRIIKMFESPPRKRQDEGALSTFGWLSDSLKGLLKHFRG